LSERRRVRLFGSGLGALLFWRGVEVEDEDEEVVPMR
jgi:hypothetical protein